MNKSITSVITTTSIKKLFFFAFLLLISISGFSHNLDPEYVNNTIIEESCIADIIINELDADTAGTDTMEFVELYDGGVGNSPLDGMVLVLYNGSNNLSYAAYDLDGQTTNPNGYFVIGNAAVANVDIVIPSNGLQNGADAAGLYTGDGTDFPNGSAVTTTNLIDALVYDTNDSDDPELLVLLNAGQSQINEDAAGDKDVHSSQRIPNGAGGTRNTSTYGQFIPTPGVANVDPSAVPEFIINELDADTAGTDTLEFLEIYDGGVGNVALDGMVIVLFNGSNNLSYAAYDLDGQTTNAEGYFVIGNAAVANVSIVIPSNGLQNGADAAGLYTGDGTDFPNGSAVTTTNLIDALVYDTNDSDDPELLVLLNAGQSQINEDGAGDKDSHSSQRIPNGSGGARNTDTYAQLEPTPGAANDAPAPMPEFIINELDADTAGTDTMEFVELFDGGLGNSSLDGMVLVFYNGSNNLSYASYDLDGQTTNAEGFFVIGNAAVPNVSIVIPSNGLQNGADAVGLYTGDDTDFPNGSAVTTSSLIDAIVYDTNDSDDPELITLLNAAEPQVNEGGAGDKDAHSSQRFANGTGGARNTSTYVQAIPTPGASNTNATEPATLVINEVDADTAGTDTMEFVELFDGGTGNTSLSGFVLVVYNGNSDTSYNAFDLDGFSTDADGYFVMGNTAVPNVSLVVGSNSLQNGADAVALYSGNATDFPNGTGVTTTNLVDALVYDTNDSDDAGLLVLLNAGQAQINEGELGNKDGHSNQRIPNGQGGVRNTDTYSQLEPTPGTINGTPAPVAEIIINELDADTVGSDTMEFVEIFDGGIGNTSLTGLVVVLFNGNSDTSYNAYDLDGFTTDVDGYFVLGNATVPNVSLVISDNSIQNGTDAVAIYTGDDTDFPNGTSISTINLVDALVYDTNDADDAGLLVLLNPGQAQINEGELGDSSGHSNQRIPNGAGGARNTDTYAQLEPTPGEINGAVVPILISLIHEVQGGGLISPMAGATVRVDAIVVGDFQATDQLSGFFIQEEDADADADAATSEGVFVYCDSCTTNVSVGDAVTVTGLAVDFFGMTQIDVTAPSGDIIVNSSGNTLPSSASIVLPAGSSTEAEGTFESTEGMLVNITTDLVVSEYFELARYGQLVLSANNRIRQFTDSDEPDVANYNTYISQLDQSRIILDDDNNIQSDAISLGPDEPYFWPRPGASNTNFIRGGDQISNLQGIMHWSFSGQSGTDAWRIRPVEEAFTYDFTPINPRSVSPPDVGGAFKVASFNVLNFFTTFGERGADSTAELDRQRVKIAAAICNMNADIVGLIEIENNGMVALDDLLNGLNGINTLCGITYAAVDTGMIGTDAITTAFIYNTATVSEEGAFAILDSSVDPLFDDTKNRPVLAQTFTQISNGGKLTVAVNHLKSKGSSCDSIGDPDLGDGAGNCNITRTNAAIALVNWLATDPTNSEDPDFMIIGDLNSYRNETPIDAIKLGADNTNGTPDDFVDLLDAYLGDDAYSYVFDGQLGYLDYALASQSLMTQITDAAAWHINADEANIYDYNDGIQDPGEPSFARKSNALPIFEANSFRASDHDPLIVGINMGVAPIIDCPDPIIVSNDMGVCGAQVFFISATANDPDGDLDIITQTGGPDPGAIFPLGESTIQFTATDLAGNSSICSFTITVIDDEDPVSVCPADIIVSNDPGQCDAVVTFSTSATDNCAGATSISVPASGSVFSMGTTMVTVTSTDASGNTNVCTFDVTVGDNESPVVSCSADIIVSNDSGQCDAVVDFTPTATDNCPGTTISSVPASNSAFPIGTTTVTVTATDAAGNIDVCTFDVTVNDTEEPVLTCPEDIVFENFPGQCYYVIVGDEFDPIATDNCTGLTVINDINGTSSLDGEKFLIGETLVSWTVDDGNGNVLSCPATVTVIDTEAPELICPEDQTQFLEDGDTFWEVPDFFAIGEASATDNCTDSDMLFITQVPEAGTLLPEGVYTISIDAKDETGNFSTCTFELTIETILGVGDNDLNLESIVMYPNPANNYVILNNPQILNLNTVEIYDIKGMLIQTMDLSNMGTEVIIDVSRLASAIYMVVIKGENRYAMKQLIKK